MSAPVTIATKTLYRVWIHAIVVLSYHNMGITTSKQHLIDELHAVRAAKLRALETGQMVQVPGAFSTQAVSYDALCRRESVIVGRLLQAGGAKTRNRTRYTDYSSGRDWSE